MTTMPGSSRTGFMRLAQLRHSSLLATMFPPALAALGHLHGHEVSAEQALLEIVHVGQRKRDIPAPVGVLRPLDGIAQLQVLGVERAELAALLFELAHETAVTLAPVLEPGDLPVDGVDHADEGVPVLGLRVEHVADAGGGLKPFRRGCGVGARDAIVEQAALEDRERVLEGDTVADAPRAQQFRLAEQAAMGHAEALGGAAILEQ